jgi:hypothetical protein
LHKHWRLIAAVLAIVLGVVAIVLWGSVQLQGPAATAPPNAAEWLSAIPTFWGAVAGGIGAIGTAGALLIAAFSYRHQVEARNREAEDRRQEAADKRREKARAVRVAVSDRDDEPGAFSYYCDLKNFGELPVTDVQIVGIDSAGEEVGRRLLKLLIPEKPERTILRGGPVDPSKSFVSFRDTEGLSWKLYFDDRLEEQVPTETIATTGG